MKKRILLVSDTKNWGGWVRGEYIKKYLSDEFDFTLVDDQEFSEIELKMNPVFSVDDVENFKKVNTDKQVFYFDKFKQFVENKGKEQFYLIYLLFHTMLPKKNVRRLIENNHKIMTIVTGFNPIKPIFMKGRINTFSQHSNGCCAIGANSQLGLDNLLKVYKGRTFYAPRGVDEEIFYPMSMSPKGNNEKFVVAYVGKPVPEKGLDKLIKPVCKNVGVDIIINDRNYTNALTPKEMNDFYNRADCYIVSSTIDGTPNPALEAAACGKPIISNHIGNMPEFIKHGFNGFLVPKNNWKIDDYVKHLTFLKNNRKKCFNMGMNARKTILESWTWKKVTENERAIFRELLDE